MPDLLAQVENLFHEPGGPARYDDADLVHQAFFQKAPGSLGRGNIASHQVGAPGGTELLAEPLDQLMDQGVTQVLGILGRGAAAQ